MNKVKVRIKRYEYITNFNEIRGVEGKGYILNVDNGVHEGIIET